MKPTAYLIVLLTCSSLEGIVCASDREDHPIELLADEVKIHGDQISTVGPTSIVWGTLRADGQSLIYDPSAKLFQLGGPLALQTRNLLINAERLVLNIGTLTLSLEKPSMQTSWGASILAEAERGSCNGQGCRFSSAKITPLCRESRSCHWSIESVSINQDGKVTLRRGALRAGRVPIFYIPWVQLNPPTQAGILPPRLEYRHDAGLIIGPAFYGPLGSGRAAWGSVAWRTKGGFETNLTLEGAHSQTAIYYIHTGDEDHLMFEMDAGLESTYGRTTLSLQLLNSVEAIDEFNILPAGRIRSHTMSRGLVTTPAGPIMIESSALMMQPLTNSTSDVWDSLHSEASLGLFLPATHLVDGLFIDASAEMKRVQLWSNVLRSDALDQPLQSHTQLHLSPGLTFAGRLGPLVQRLSIHSSHHIWLVDRSHGSGPRQSTGTGSLYLALPVARRFLRSMISHVIEPSITYRNSLFVTGRTPSWILTTQDLPRAGHGVEFALETRLEHLWHNQVAKLKVGQRLDLPGHWQTTTKQANWAYLFWDATIGTRTLQIATEGAVDERLKSLSIARLGLRTSLSRMEAHLGGEYIGTGLGPHLDQPTFDQFATPYTSPWPQVPERQAGLWGAFNLHLPFEMNLFGSLRLKAWPEFEWHTLRYGLLYNSPCSLMSIGVQAIHFGQLGVPDILATIVIR